MRRISNSFPIIVVVMLMAALAVPLCAKAQDPGHRANTWEFQVPVTYSQSWNGNGEGGSNVDVNSVFGLGLGFGYNFTDHFQLGGSLNWGSRSYDATIVNTDGTNKKATGTLESSTIALNATYFLLATGLTPYVSAGIGSTFLDSNIPNGQGSTGCWWDPWWGYICNSYTPTKTETDLSYTAGLGVRWDVNRVLSLQAGYDRMWIETSKSQTPEISNWTLGFVFRM
jgi:opacity protein-like surface antigen